MKIDIITLFPELIETPLNASMIKQATKRGVVEIKIHNLRSYGLDRHKTCDDKPFGGGAGMVMMIQPVFDCLKEIKGSAWRIMPSPRGKVFNHQIASRLAQTEHLIFLCGHYEGIDERVHEHLIDEELSIGDFVTTGGEFPVLCFIDAIIRLIPGALGNQKSLESESFTKGFLDFPHYTRPREFNKWKVPEVLFSGDHQAIQAWRDKKSLELTKKIRPDLLGRKNRTRRDS